jgi:hypothetical protein
MFSRSIINLRDQGNLQIGARYDTQNNDIKHNIK